MDEQTTTANEELENGAQGALPNQEQENAAALAVNEQKNSQTEGDATASLPEVDDKLISFAKGQGIEDVSNLSPREMGLLKSAYDNKAQYERDRQKAADLEKSISGSTQKALGTQTPEDDVVGNLQSTVNSLLIKDQVNSFFSNKDIDTTMRPVMAEMVNNDPTLGALVENGHLSLSQLYNMARGENVESIKQDGGKEALQQLANKQTATAVQGAATTSAMTPSKGDPLMELWS